MVKVLIDNAKVIVPASAGMEIADISGTTATASSVLNGYKFVNPDGRLDTGKYMPVDYEDFDGLNF